ncbi:hypothetical protein [Nostoc sp. UHCC 0251]|uniref:hypothetical protein n=1 Tax=Nostoc sp. UHCC 0251 TaxID=3110240 RepID=UPI002B1FD269|nr:hypothetical protein [Nostoc sp. UHCC 0251]MEA5621715.1 hypothetical protein [Nostoc sp. UHCC 0251]
MGTRDWGLGDEEAGGDEGTRRINNPCPMPNAPCPVPHAQSPMPNAQFGNLRYNARHLLIVSCHVLMTND